MPQLDKSIIFPQIFWLFVIFLSFYIIISYYFLPKFIKSIKLRQLIIEKNNFCINKIDDNFKKIIFINKSFLLDSLKVIANSANYFNLHKLNNLFFNYKKKTLLNLDLKIINSIFYSSVYCNKFNLQKIKFYPKNLNHK